MKAEDLMIDDLISMNGVVRRVTSVHKRESDAGVDLVTTIIPGFTFPDSNLSFLPDYANPIPLTPEILEQNGFVEKNVFAETLGIEVFGLEEFSCGISDYEGGTWLFEVFKPWSTCAPDGSPEDWGFLTEMRIPGIKHVHELQHALKLGGIEKEIVL